MITESQDNVGTISMSKNGLGMHRKKALLNTTVVSNIDTFYDPCTNIPT